MSQTSLMTIPDMQPWMAFPVSGAVILLLVQQYRSYRRRAAKLYAYQMALKRLDRMIQLDSSNAMAYWQKGEVYEAMEMHDHALRFYQAAHRLCPRAYDSHEFLGVFNRIKPKLKTKAVPTLSFSRN